MVPLTVETIEPIAVSWIKSPAIRISDNVAVLSTLMGQSVSGAGQIAILGGTIADPSIFKVRIYPAERYQQDRFAAIDPPSGNRVGSGEASGAVVYLVSLG